MINGIISSEMDIWPVVNIATEIGLIMMEAGTLDIHMVIGAKIIKGGGMQMEAGTQRIDQ